MRTNQSGEYSADALDLAQARREKDEYQEELVEARELIERLRQDIQVCAVAILPLLSCRY